MMKLKWSTIFAALLLSTVLLAPAQATTIFSFSDNTQDFNMTFSSGPNTDTLTISATVTGITMSGAGYNPCGAVVCSATFTLVASSTTAAVPEGPFLDQVGWSGTFSFSDLHNANTSYVYYLGTFLAGNFTLGEFTGQTGGSSANLNSSDPTLCAATSTCGKVNLTTAFYWFLYPNPLQNPQGISLQFLSWMTNPPPANTGLSLNASSFVASAKASGGGAISSDLETPEPSTMLLLGGALIGLGVIGRKRRSI